MEEIGTDILRGAVKKFPEFFDIDSLVHHAFIQPGQSYWSFLRARFAEVARWSWKEAAQQVAGRDSGFCITITHRVTYRLLCHHPETLLSGSRSERLLAVPYSENGSQEDTFRNHGGTSNRMRRPNFGRFQKKNLHPVLPSVAGSVEQERMCAQGSYFKGD
jgi:hypothetical protein